MQVGGGMDLITKALLYSCHNSLTDHNCIWNALGGAATILVSGFILYLGVYNCKGLWGNCTFV